MPDQMTPKQMRALADQAEQEHTVFEHTFIGALRAAAATIELLVQQRDALAEVAGIEPEWTEADA